MKTKLIFALLVVALVACNKQKKLMKDIVGNWDIEQSERAIVYSNGTEDFYDQRENAGQLVISADPNDGSGETKHYAFDFYGPNNDTMHLEGTLSTDEKNKRIVFKNALCDSTTFCDVIWTLDKSKKNKMIWSVYGVDTTFYYPTNKFNPGNANNWLMWRVSFRRQGTKGFSGS